MRSLILYGVRAQKDDLVDRPEVEVQQCMELTGTNSPRACPTIMQAIQALLTVAVTLFGFEGAARYAPLAQLVEHLTLNQGVQGSSP